MSQLSKLLRDQEDGRGGTQLAFQCPGCKTAHAVGIGAGAGPRWGYNGNAEKPTFTPSVLVRRHEMSEEGNRMLGAGERPPNGRYPGREMVCHSFVTDGRIQFLGDCTHALAGQTVDLPDWSDE